MSKAAKRRPCPAVQHEISSAECGENRISRYPCPPECPHNTFAPTNYGQILKLEDVLDQKTGARFAREVAGDPSLITNQTLLNKSSLLHTHSFFVWNYLFRRDGAGRTFAQRWEAAGFTELKNDERVFLRAKMQMRVALLEIHRVLDSERIEAIDLLSSDPGALILRDRGLASQAVRFGVLLAWIYPLPHFWRLSGAATMIPEMAQIEPAVVVREIVAHLGGSTSEPEIRGWLAEYFVRFSEALDATCNARRMQMFAGMDAQFGKAIYELRAPFAQCRDRLVEKMDVESDRLSPAERNEGFVEARVCFEEEPASRLAQPEGAQVVLGRLLLGQAHWRLESMGAKRLAALRRKFETAMGNAVRFSGERRDDLVVDLLSKQSKGDRSLVPPRLLEKPQQVVLNSSRVPALAPGVSKEEALAKYVAEQERAFLDDTIPALNGRTPREASRLPALRPILIRLLKQRVAGCDRRNLETGRSDDINWMLRELGANEILFEPPPRRSPPVRKEDVNLIDDTDVEETPDLPLPMLSKEPLSKKEAERRINSVMETFDAAADAMDELDASGSTFISDAHSLVEEWIKPELFSLLVTFLIQIRFSLVPVGFREPQLEFDELQVAFDRELDKFIDAGSAADTKELIKFFEESRQPALTQFIVTQFLLALSTMPKKLQPPPKIQPIMFILLKVMIDELDRALKE